MVDDRIVILLAGVGLGSAGVAEVSTVWSDLSEGIPVTGWVVIVSELVAWGGNKVMMGRHYGALRAGGRRNVETQMKKVRRYGPAHLNVWCRENAMARSAHLSPSHPFVRPFTRPKGAIVMSFHISAVFHQPPCHRRFSSPFSDAQMCQIYNNVFSLFFLLTALFAFQRSPFISNVVLTPYFYRRAIMPGFESLHTRLEDLRKQTSVSRNSSTWTHHAESIPHHTDLSSIRLPKPPLSSMTSHSTVGSSQPVRIRQCSGNHVRSMISLRFHWTFSDYAKRPSKL